MPQNHWQSIMVTGSAVARTDDGLENGKCANPTHCHRTSITQLSEKQIQSQHVNHLDRNSLQPFKKSLTAFNVIYLYCDEMNSWVLYTCSITWLLFKHSTLLRNQSHKYTSTGVEVTGCYVL